MFSSKIHSIVKGIQKSEGIVFIYSEYLSSGIIPVALALEHAGYGKYGGNDMLNYPNWKPNEQYDKETTY